MRRKNPAPARNFADVLMQAVGAQVNDFAREAR